MFRKPEGFESFRTVSELARYVGKSTRTMERWHSKGFLPEPAVRLPDGTKLWGPGQCEEVLSAVISQLPSERAKSRRIT